MDELDVIILRITKKVNIKTRPVVVEFIMFDDRSVRAYF